MRTSLSSISLSILIKASELIPILSGLAVFARSDTADHLSPVLEATFGVKGAHVSRNPLANDSRVSIDQNTHSELPRFVMGVDVPERFPSGPSVVHNPPTW